MEATAYICNVSDDLLEHVTTALAEQASKLLPNSWVGLLLCTLFSHHMSLYTEIHKLAAWPVVLWTA